MPQRSRLWEKESSFLSTTPPSPRLYSVSQLKLFQLCPLRYRFQYIDQLRADVQQVESFVGCLVHDALAYLYETLTRGETPPVSEVITFYKREWELRWTRNIKITNPEYSREWYRRFGEKCLRNYYGHFYPFQEEGTEIVGIEWSFQFRLDDTDRYWMHGQIDRLERTTDDIFTVYDYKTTRYVPPQYRLQQDLQPGVYQLAIHYLYPDAQQVNVEWHYLSRKRVLRPTLPSEGVRRVENQVKSMIDAITSTERFDPKPSPACRWCDYRGICPAYEESPEGETHRPPVPRKHRHRRRY